MYSLSVLAYVYVLVRVPFLNVISESLRSCIAEDSVPFEPTGFALISSVLPLKSIVRFEPEPMITPFDVVSARSLIVPFAT